MNTTKALIKKARKTSKPVKKLYDTEKAQTKKARRKWYLSILADRLRQYELELPKEQRGSWNSRVAYEYKPKVNLATTNILDIENFEDAFSEYVTNKYGETIYEKTKDEKKQGYNYNHLNNTGNQLRWNRLKNCQSTIKEATDRTTGEVINKATHKCNDKLCGNCSQIRSIVAVTKYKNKVKAMTNPVMVVLHQRSPGIGELKGTIDAMYNDWRTIMKVQAKSNRESFNGICALEVTTNEIQKTYHPHYHIVIEEHQAVDLVNKWLSADPINREEIAHTNKSTGKVYSELPKDEKGNFNIHELFKYAMKMSVTNQDTPGNKLKTIGSTPMIYEIAKALKGVQQWRPFGNFRNTQNTKEIAQAIANEMLVSKTDWPHIRSSKEWKYKKCDWEATELPGMWLTGWEPTKRDRRFMKLTNQETNNFTNEKERNTILQRDVPIRCNPETNARRSEICQIYDE